MNCYVTVSRNLGNQCCFAFLSTWVRTRVLCHLSTSLSSVLLPRDVTFMLGSQDCEDLMLAQAQTLELVWPGFESCSGSSQVCEWGHVLNPLKLYFSPVEAGQNPGVWPRKALGNGQFWFGLSQSLAHMSRDPCMSSSFLMMMAFVIMVTLLT